jgi:hypothetical protein
VLVLLLVIDPLKRQLDYDYDYEHEQEHEFK